MGVGVAFEGGRTSGAGSHSRRISPVAVSLEHTFCFLATSEWSHSRIGVGSHLPDRRKHCDFATWGPWSALLRPHIHLHFFTWGLPLYSHTTSPLMLMPLKAPTTYCNLSACTPVWKKSTKSPDFLKKSRIFPWADFIGRLFADFFIPKKVAILFSKSRLFADFFIPEKVAILSSKSRLFADFFQKNVSEVISLIIF